MAVSEETETRLQNAVLLLGAFVLLGAAAIATIISVTGYFMLCDENCDGRSWELIWQLVAAGAGLIATCFLTVLVATREPRGSGWALLAAIVLYAVWAVLLDAATHGWGNGPVPL